MRPEYNIYCDESCHLLNDDSPVMVDRKQYILPWTAYLVDYNNRKRKLLKEYEVYKNAETAQGD